MHQRRSISSKDAARLLDRNLPKEDPNFLKESRVKTFMRALIPAASTELNCCDVHSHWKKFYNNRLHESAFEEMADPGEQCDGELPSWTRDRLKAEKDKSFTAPSVSGHEATVRLKQKVEKNDQ